MMHRTLPSTAGDMMHRTLPSTAEPMAIASQKKICGMCGVVGYAEDIVTCCQCNQSYEHTYCMKKQPDFIQEKWRCDGCLANNQVSCITREPDKVTCSKFYTRRVPVSKNSLSNHEDKSIQIHREQHIGTHGSVLAQESSSGAPETGNGRSCTTFASPGTNIKQLISSGRDENPKLQFIPVEELVAPRAKAMTARNGQTLGPALTRTNQEEVVHSSVPQRAFRNISSSRTSNRVPFQQNVGTPIPELLYSKSPSDNVVNANKERVQNYNTSGEGLHRICKKVKREDSVSSEAYYPQSKNPMLTEFKTLVPIKEELVEECVNVRSKAIQSSKAKCAIATYQHTEGAAHNQGVNKFNGNTMNSVGGYREVSYQRNDPPSALVIVPAGEHLNHPCKEPFWMGDFEVSGSVSYVYERIQAHVGSNVSPKAYTTLCQLPQRMKFKLLSRLDVWPRFFQSNPPDTKDVALYFFPRELHRSTNYFYLLEGMNQSDLAMQGCIGHVELLMFSSKQLPEGSLGLAAKMFLWGVLHHKKRKEQNMHVRELIPAQTHVASMGDACRRETIKLESKVDVGIKDGVDHACSRTNVLPERRFRPMVPTTHSRSISELDPRGFSAAPPGFLDSPPGFLEPYVRRMEHEKKLHAQEKVISTTVPDVPPGFSYPYSWRNGSSSLQGAIQSHKERR